MLNSQPFVLADKITLLIDTEYFNLLLPSENTRGKTLLQYRAFDNLEFIRTAGQTPFEILRHVPAYSEQYDEAGNLQSITIAEAERRRTISFGYRMAHVETAGKHVLGKPSLSAREVQALTKVFVWAAIIRFGSAEAVATDGTNLTRKRSSCNIFVTDNKGLLHNRLWFESNFPGCPLGIASLDEATEVLDLFLKHRRKYHILSDLTCNKGYWYLLSFRTRLRHFRFGIPILDALATRFIYLLMSLDEIGFQYFSGVDNDTMDDALYHFYYFVSLVTGVFDSLAIRTNEQYGLGFEDAPVKVSLNPNAGRNFLRAIREKHPELRKQIQSHVYLIKLMYALREAAVHREMLDSASVQSLARGERWRMNLVRVDAKVVQLLRQCGDRPQNHDVVTEWGLHQFSEQSFLEPYHFAKSATRNLTDFADKYLELLGFGDFVEEGRREDPHDRFVRAVEQFEGAKLGF